MLRFLGLDASSSDGVGRVVAFGSRQLRLHRLLAQGGRATIYEARDVGTGEALAVKRILAADEEGAELAEREITTHRALRHEAILSCLGEAAERRRDGTAEYLMLLPLCVGGHLWDHASSTPMRPLSKLRALEQISAALDFMHERGLAHFDIKLENILVHCNGGRAPASGGDISLFLCDFGSTLSSPENEPGGILPTELDRRGRYALEEWINSHTTPMYRAPELCDLHSGLRVGPACDVWALGCLLYTLCFGTHPFAEATPVQILSGKWSLPMGAQVISHYCFTLPHSHRHSNRLIHTDLFTLPFTLPYSHHPIHTPPPFAGGGPRPPPHAHTLFSHHHTRTYPFTGHF
jgi:cyclin G-associated kinase